MCVCRHNGCLLLPKNDAMGNFKGLPVLIWVEISLYKQSIDDSYSQTNPKDSFFRREKNRFRVFVLFFLRYVTVCVNSSVSLSHCVVSSVSVDTEVRTEQPNVSSVY